MNSVCVQGERVDEHDPKARETPKEPAFRVPPDDSLFITIEQYIVGGEAGAHGQLGMRKLPICLAARFTV